MEWRGPSSPRFLVWLPLPIYFQQDDTVASRKRKFPGADGVGLEGPRQPGNRSGTFNPV